MTARLLALLVCLACATAAHAAQRRAQMRTVYQEKSLYRNILVTEGGVHRCITFGRYHGEQSCVDLTQPDRLVFAYTRGLFAAFYAASQPRRVLVIGLGGGTVPKAIRHVFPDVDVDSVELDPAVARVASSHFGFVANARTRVFVDDGRVFVRKQRRAGVLYDVVLVDAFEKDYIPEHMLTREFLSEIKGVLAPGGIVAANTFTRGALRNHESATYQAVFGEGYEVDMAGGNRIILAARDGLPALDAMANRGRSLDAALVPIDVKSSELLPRFKLRPPLPHVRVLTDQFAPSNLLLEYRH